MKIGIIKERKTPSDSRVVFDPSQCKRLVHLGIDLVVESSDVRCFSDEDYRAQDIKIVSDVSDCDVLLGVKEVPIDALISNKTYFFFSHTIKEQEYNRGLLQAIIKKNIRLIDYEVLTNDQGTRVIAFGRFAGMVGAHNALWTYGQRSSLLSMSRMKDLYDYQAAQAVYADINIPPVKIVLTGTGRVANGAAEVLQDMGIQKVRPIDYVTTQYDGPVFTQLNSFYYARRKDGEVFDDVRDFYNNPAQYDSDFHHFLPMSDIMINGIYWDNDAPAFFTKDQMKTDKFGIKVIADVTCDIAPVSSIPSTLRASTIDDPVFGYDAGLDQEVAAFSANAIDVMSIDNLPNEMPRDASTAFGEMFIDHVLPALKNPNDKLLNRATIAHNGVLGDHFDYLSDYIEG